MENGMMDCTNTDNKRFEKPRPKHDVFLRLVHPTIDDIRSVFEWTNKHALKTFISYLDVTKSCSRISSDKELGEVVNLINRKAKPYFRIILRSNFNWFLILTEEKHIEDVVEVFIRGIEIDSKEYFIQCYLEKELLRKLKRNFMLAEL